MTTFRRSAVNPMPTQQPAVDAAPSFDVPLARPFANGRELELVDEVLGSGVLRDGPMLRRFEERFAHATGAAVAVAVTSPLAALQLVAASVGWGAGDDLVATPFTTVPSQTITRVLGVTTTYVDIDPTTLGIDPATIDQAIGSRTRGLVAVDSFGWPADLHAVADVAERNDLVLVSDVAGALGSSARPAVIRMFTLATESELAIGGGAVLCCDDHVQAGAWRELAGTDGFDCRLGDVAAAVGLAQLERLSRSIAMREMVAADYARLLAGVDGVQVPAGSLDGRARTWPRYWVLFDDAPTRDHVHHALAARDIETARPRPFDPVATPPRVAADVAGRALALPCYPQMSPQQQERVVAALGDVLDAR